jgi:glycosyltransferase involved in cell wall biosynthesis
MKKIHYHSHAGFFSGAENMLVNFFSSLEVTSNFDISFSYVYSKKYEAGLIERVGNIPPTYPISSPSSLNWTKFIPGYPHLIVRSFGFIVRTMFLIPLFAYEMFVLYRLFSGIRPDILHINNSGYPSSTSARIAAISAKLAKVPSIIMVVNNMALDYKRPSRLVDFPLDKLVAYSVTQFITGSQAAGVKLKNVLNLNDDKHQAIHNGVSLLDRTETPSEVRCRLGLKDFNGTVFGVVAMLKPNKGHRILLESVSKIIRQDPKASNKIKILIEGEGPLLNELGLLINNLGLSNHCVLVGREKHIVNFMSFIDVLILPSIEYEDFPNVVIEAMGLGKPVIASLLAGTPEQVVDGVSGILVEPGNSNELSLAIVKMCSNKNTLLKMGLAGRSIFQNKFTSKIAVERYVKLYKTLSSN